MKQKFKQLKAYLKRKNKLILQDPKTFEEKFALSINNRNSILVGTAIVLIFGFIVYLVISYTSLKKFIPGYPKNASELFEIDKSNLNKINELETKNTNRDLWITNLQNILNEEDSILLKDINDTLIKDSTFDYKKVIFERIKEDSILRKKVENYNNTNQNSIIRSILISILKYEKPHDGKITGRKEGSLNQASFKARYKSKVRAAMEGTVISKSENSLVLQHQNNIVSVYKNFTDVTPKIGQVLNKGIKIGIVKDSVFQFQIWHNGVSIPVEAYEDL
ncbi:M23 family metallopeptidase [bacterium]|nr:M23 family metallopeptidase [bacterium]MDB4089257.1 M23 family metallopeptidase [Flavobacteriales bacterium]